MNSHLASSLIDCFISIFPKLALLSSADDYSCAGARLTITANFENGTFTIPYSTNNLKPTIFFKKLGLKIECFILFCSQNRSDVTNHFRVSIQVFMSEELERSLGYRFFLLFRSVGYNDIMGRGFDPQLRGTRSITVINTGVRRRFAANFTSFLS